MKVSLICPTENRAAFIPWLAHTFNALRCPPGVEKELVVVDSTADNLPVVEALESMVSDMQGVYQWVDTPGCSIASKRNLGLELATGDVIGWLDDDDGKAPGWLEWAVGALGDKDLLRVKTRIQFVSIVPNPFVVRWMATQWYSAGLYRAKAARLVRFNDAVRSGEDTQWHGATMAAVPAVRQVFVVKEGLGFALSHAHNIANAFTKPAFWRHPLSRPEMWTPAEWERTVGEMHALRKRLGYGG